MSGNDKQTPLIVGFVADLMFTARIEDVARRLEYRVHWIEHAAQVAPPDPSAPKRQPAEHMLGPGAALLEQLTAWQPALILFDLSNKDVPWREWVALIKSVSATRRMPVICFGSHVDVDTMQAARRAGADLVLARSRFVSDLPNLIQKHARIPDYAALGDACQEPLSDLALQGLAEFNHGEFFEAHESLEYAWNADQTAGRELYRAILQVAVAYLQIERQNYNGAVKMFLRLRQWIEPLPELCRGVNVDQLRKDAQAAYEMLVALGPERIAEFDRRLMRPVQYVLPE